MLNRHDILEHVKQLPPEERERLVHEIWQTMDVDPDDPPLSPAWEAEIKRRIDAHERGETKATNVEEFFARIEGKLSAREASR